MTAIKNGTVKIRLLFFLLLLSLSACQFTDGLKRQKERKIYSEKVISFLNRTKSSLEYSSLYTDSSKYGISLSYNFYDSYNDYSGDVIALQEFLATRHMEYGFIVTIDETGSTSTYDKSTYNHHQKCLKTVLNFVEAIKNQNLEKISSFLDKTKLNEKPVHELFQFLGPIKTAEMIQYQFTFNDFNISQSEMFAVCLNYDQVIMLTLNYENTKLIQSCDLVGNNCTVPQPRKKNNLLFFNP